MICRSLGQVPDFSVWVCRGKIRNFFYYIRTALETTTPTPPRTTLDTGTSTLRVFTPSNVAKTKVNGVKRDRRALLEKNREDVCEREAFTTLASHGLCVFRQKSQGSICIPVRQELSTVVLFNDTTKTKLASYNSKRVTTTSTVGSAMRFHFTIRALQGMPLW